MMSHQTTPRSHSLVSASCRAYSCLISSDSVGKHTSRFPRWCHLTESEASSFHLKLFKNMCPQKKKPMHAQRNERRQGATNQMITSIAAFFTNKPGTKFKVTRCCQTFPTTTKRRTESFQNTSQTKSKLTRRFISVNR